MSKHTVPPTSEPIKMLELTAGVLIAIAVSAMAFLYAIPN